MGGFIPMNYIASASDKTNNTLIIGQLSLFLDRYLVVIQAFKLFLNVSLN